MKLKKSMSEEEQKQAVEDFKDLLERPPSTVDNRELIKWLGQLLGVYEGD